MISVDRRYLLRKSAGVKFSNADGARFPFPFVSQCLRQRIFPPPLIFCFCVYAWALFFNFIASLYIRKYHNIILSTCDVKRVTSIKLKVVDFFLSKILFVFFRRTGWWKEYFNILWKFLIFCLTPMEFHTIECQPYGTSKF